MSDIKIKNAAHDLNNILTSIINNIYYLKTTDELSADATKTLSIIENDAKRAAAIIASAFLDKKRINNGLQEIHLNHIVEEAVSTIRTGLPNGISLTTEKENQLPVIIADNTDIYRIIFNLVKNAVEAIHGNGSVIVKTSYTQGNVELKVIDSGEGIKPENIEKIFDYKFSTKDKNTESGFGLGIVKEKVEELGGKIIVRSDENGTEFNVLFPPLLKDKERTLNILLAEDDQSVLEVLSDLLESYNHKVTKVMDGIELLEQAANNQFDIFLIDNKLPGKNGLECIKEIRESGIDSAIILASGSDINQSDEGIKQLQINKIIRKPYSFPEIIKSISELI